MGLKEGCVEEGDGGKGGDRGEDSKGGMVKIKGDKSYVEKETKGGNSNCIVGGREKGRGNGGRGWA